MAKASIQKPSSKNIVLSDQRELSSVTTSILIEGSRFSERSGLKSRNVLNTDTFCTLGNMAATEDDTTVASRTFHVSFM